MSEQLTRAVGVCRGLPSHQWGVGAMTCITAAYLAEHPADDAEPITRQWVRDIGFVRPQQPAASDRWASADVVPGEHTGTVLPVVSVEFPRPRHDVVPVWEVGVYGHARFYEWCPTRGDVRRLCAALGVLLIEPPKGVPRA